MVSSTDRENDAMPIRTRIDDWNVRRRVAPEIPLSQLLAEATDYGLGPAEFRRIALMSSEQIDRRNRMAQLNGLDPARIEEDRALDIATALCCADCADEGRCRMAIKTDDPAGGADFCADSAIYRTLAAE